MTLQELAAETLMQKHKRLTQAKCAHRDTYSSTVSGPNDTFTNGFCWDCGKSWRVVDGGVEQFSLTPPAPSNTDKGSSP